MAAILETKNYNLFDLDSTNREVKRDSYRFKNLVNAMSRHGWIDAYPVHAYKGKNGKLKIKAGHHRLASAVELGIPVKYVVTADSMTIHELEQAGPGAWSIDDFLHSYSAKGNEHYSTVERYCEETGIGIQPAISMFGGHTATSAGFGKKFKSGEFRVENTEHPKAVAEISKIARKSGFEAGSHRNFVAAVSKALKTEGVDGKRLKDKLKTHPYTLKKQSTVDGYLAVLEEAYNRQAHDKFPLAFAANQSAAKRSAKK